VELGIEYHITNTVRESEESNAREFERERRERVGHPFETPQAE
jgi:hypothetical protein